MAETITVSVPELPLVDQVSGDELLAVWDGGRLGRIPQAALRGTRTFTGSSEPPSLPSEIMALRPIVGDRWRHTGTGDEWKVVSLDPFVWEPDGNVKGADGASNEPGPAGSPGQAGPPGASGRTLSKPAGQVIPDWSAVILTADDTFQLANPENPSHSRRVIGVVAQGGPTGATVVAQSAGDVRGPNGGFTPGSPLFVGANGALVAAPPTSGWRQAVATAVSSNQIVVTLGEARIVADEAPALPPAGGGLDFIVSVDGVPTDIPPGDTRVGAALTTTPVSVGDRLVPVAEIGADAVGQMSLTRAAIASTAILAPLVAFVSSGFNLVGDPGRGAPYMRGASDGPGAIQDKTGAWWQLDLSGGIVRPEWWGGFPNGSANCTTAFDRADYYAYKLGLDLIGSAGTYMVTGIPYRGQSRWLFPYGKGEIKLMPFTKARVIGRQPPPVPAAGSGQEEKLVPLIYSLSEETGETFFDKVGTGALGGVHSFRIDGLHVNGNRQNGGKCHGLGIYGSVFEITNCLFRNNSGVGRWTEYPFGDIPTVHKNAQSQFRNCYMLENRIGYRYGGPNDSEFYSDYPYLNDAINAHHYYAGTGKIIFGHPWTDAPPGPQAKIGYLFDSPGNIMVGSAPEGAKEVQIWIRANHQKLTGLYTFYNQLTQVGDDVVGIRIGDNGTDPDYLPGVRQAANAAAYCQIYGTVQNVNTCVQFRNDGGFHDIRVVGFSTRSNPIDVTGQQYLTAQGLPTSDILVKVVAVNQSGTPIAPVRETFHQVPDRVDYFKGFRVLSGTASVGVSEPVAPLDVSGFTYVRETDKAGGVFSTSWTSGILRQTCDRITGGYKDWAQNAYGTDQITFTSNGVKLFTLPFSDNAAAVAAGLPAGVVYVRPDGSLAVRV